MPSVQLYRVLELLRVGTDSEDILGYEIEMKK